MLIAGAVMLALAALFAFLPRLLAYPAVAGLAWVASTLLLRGFKLYRRRKLGKGGLAGPQEPAR
jgi:hypothetical protein